MRIPSSIQSGDSSTWYDDQTVNNAGDTIDSTWTLKYAIVGATTLTLTAAADGSGWATTITKAQSAALEAGDYYWQAYAEKAGSRATLGTGKLVILPNLSVAEDGFDGRTQNQQDLDAVRAAIRAIVAGGGNQEYTIGNRSARKYALADLIMLESQLAARVLSEQKAASIANGMGNPGNVFVRFRK